MLLENLLKGVIEKTTVEYVEIAGHDPVVKSEEDGTPRGVRLDLLIAQQDEERKELYDRLYELEEKRREKGYTVVFGKPTPANQKELLNLIHMDMEIVAKVEKEMEKLQIHEQPDDSLEEIKFRERLFILEKQLKDAIPVLEQQIDEVKLAVQRERQSIKESSESRLRLLRKEEDLKLEVESKRQTEDTLRADLVKLQKQYEKDSADMSDFLERHYPPHVVDGGRPFGEECDLKDILEKLLNRAFRNPEDPYIRLQRGTYWSPYIGTLTKAEIASYHPDDATLIRLANFKLS